MFLIQRADTAFMGTQPQTAPAEQSVPCVARQPILNADQEVLGYELSFQQSPLDQHLDVETEASIIIETLNVIGFGVLCDGRRAFIRCTQKMLTMEYFVLLPPGVVFEIQPSVPADESVLALCQKLKQAECMIALDNFELNDGREPLLPYANFIKVDVKKIPWEQSSAMVGRYANRKCQMLAQQVETRQDLALAKKAGFAQFQGYFFRHTEHLRARHIPANQTIYLRLLQAIAKPEVDFDEIEDLIKHEPSMCYRLLRYLNSPLLGLSAPVLSIRHAFNFLGERELVRWIRLASTLAMGQEKCSDLILSTLVRARFCELIAPKLKHHQSELYLMGLFSLMDAILEVPMGVAIEGLPLAPVTKTQLLCGKTDKRTPLSPIYDLMVAREAGDWGKVTKLGKELDLSLVFVAASYNEAMRWAHQLTEAARLPQVQ
jgi:c-di-GMP-related signal transduction protein